VRSRSSSIAVIVALGTTSPRRPMRQRSSSVRPRRRHAASFARSVVPSGVVSSTPSLDCSKSAS
jgi:hypothetical protein